MKILVENENFGQKWKFWSKFPTFGQKLKDLVEVTNFCQN